MDHPEAYVRRMLANTLVSSRRRAWMGEQPSQDLQCSGRRQRCATQPDTDGLITGGQSRRRRRNLALMGGVAAAAVLAGEDLGRTPSRLAAQLARLPRSEVVQPPTPTTAFGLDALHLRVRIDNRCPDDDGYLHAETLAGSHGISYSESPNVVVIDFWVVDVDGTPIVVEVFRDEDTPDELLRQASTARDSVSVVTDERE